MNSKSHVVIIARVLAALSCKEIGVQGCAVPYRRTNYHLFQPLLYQVATAALSRPTLLRPIRAILSKCSNVEVILAEVESVDVDAKEVKTVDLQIDYDYLIPDLAPEHSLFWTWRVGETGPWIEEPRGRVEFAPPDSYGV